MNNPILLSFSYWIKVLIIYVPIMFLFEITSQVALSYKLYIILLMPCLIIAYIIELSTRLSKETERLQSFLEFQKRFILKNNEDKDNHE